MFSEQEMCGSISNKKRCNSLNIINHKTMFKLVIEADGLDVQNQQPFFSAVAWNFFGTSNLAKNWKCIYMGTNQTSQLTSNIQEKILTELKGCDIYIY